MADQIIEAIASQTLPASQGTVVATLDCEDFDLASLMCEYTRAAAGGAVEIKIAYSPDGTTFIQSTQLQKGAAAPGGEATHNLIREVYKYTSQAAGAEGFELDIPDLAAKKLRLTVREVGVAGSPGTFKCLVQLSTLGPD